MSDKQTKTHVDFLQFIVPAACAFAISIGFERFFIFIMQIGVNKTLTDCGAGVLSILFSYICELVRVKKPKKSLTLILIMAACILYAAACRFLFAVHITNFARVGAGNVISTINSYYRIHLVSDGIRAVSRNSLTIGALVVAAPFIAVISYEVVAHLKCIVSVVLFVLMFAVSLMLGKAPAAVPVIWMLTGIIAVLPASQGRKKAVYEMGVMGSIVLVAALVAQTIGLPIVVQGWNAGEQLRKNISQYWYNIEHSADRISFGDVMMPFGSGGVGKGELGKSDGFVFTGKTHLKVTVNKQPSKNVYIKAYVGSRYTGDSWEEIEDAMQQEADRLEYAAYDTIYSHRSGTGGLSDEMRIECIGASRNYVYRPYGMAENQYPEAGRKSYYIKYYPTDWDVTTYFDGVLNNTEYAGTEKRYREYVYDTYLDIPSTGLEQLKNEIRNTRCSNFKEAYSYIIKRLQEENRYDIDVEATPQDKDFIEYFLYEKKAGYCTSFASAAVMMFRLMGYPARYVSGYVISSESFDETDEGAYTSVVRDDRAHAWAEVYLDGTGWVVVEATPGFVADAASIRYVSGVYNAIIYNETPIQEEETFSDENIDDEAALTAGEDDEDDEAGDTSAEDSDGSGSGNFAESFKKALVVLGKCLIVLLVAMAAVYIAYNIMRARTKRRLRLPEKEKMKNVDYNKIIVEMFHWLYNILLCAGISDDMNTHTPEFCSAFEEHYNNISAGSYGEVVQLARRANFAADELTYEDAKKVSALCALVLEREEKHASFRNKWKMYAVRKKWRY